MGAVQTSQYAVLRQQALKISRSLLFALVFLCAQLYHPTPVGAVGSITYYPPSYYDVGLAVYQPGEDYAALAETTGGKSQLFNGDGTKMYILGADTDDIHEYTLSTAYDISTATYAGTGEDFNIGAQETDPEAFVFNDDGTKFFLIGTQNDHVYEYDLGTAYDVSTATYAGALEDLDISTQENTPESLAFSTDGTRLFVVGYQHSTVFRYDLSIAFDVSSGTYAGASTDYDISAQDTLAESLIFNPFGTEMFVLGRDNDRVYHYDLSTPFTPSTATYRGIIHTKYFTTEDTFPESIAFNDIGTKLFMFGSATESAFEYVLLGDSDYLETSANDGSVFGELVIDLSGNTFQDIDSDNLLDVGSEVTINNVPPGLTPVLTLYRNDTLAVLSFTGTATDHQPSFDVADLTFEFDDTAFTVGTAAAVTNATGPASSGASVGFIQNQTALYCGAYDLNHATFTNSFGVGAQDGRPSGVVFSGDGTNMTVTGDGNNSSHEYELLTPFDITSASHLRTRNITNNQSGDTLPHGGFWSPDGTSFYFGGDNGNQVFRFLTPDPYNVTTLDFFESFSVSLQESNIRSVYFNPEGTRMYVSGEGSDSVHEYTLGTPYLLSTATFSDSLAVSGGGEDLVTGLTFNNDGTRLYVSGRRNDEVMVHTLTTGFDLTTASATPAYVFDIGPQDNNPLGLTFSEDGRSLYTTGDTNNSVYRYTIDPPDFDETLANNGAVSGSLEFRLSGDTFQDVDNDNLLDHGSEVTINNLPSGLVPVFTLSSADTVATLTFTGNASQNDSADSLSGLTFTFDDTAFSSTPAADVTRSGGPFDCHVGVSFDDGGSVTGSTLGGTVFDDIDNDGIIGGGEPGLQSVTVRLYADTNTNGFYDSGTDTLIGTTATDGSGNYEFTSVVDGDYLVVIPAAEFGSGQELFSRVSSTGDGQYDIDASGSYEPPPDPDTDINGDDNGYDLSGDVVTTAVTLSSGTEPTNDGDTDNTTNYSVDFGFYIVRYYVTLGLDDATMDLGVLSAATVSSQTQQYTLSTNNPSGAVVSFLGAATGLHDGAGNDINDVGDGTVTAGAEEYGVNMISSMNLLAPYTSGDNTIPTAVTSFVNTSGAPVVGGTASITYRASRDDATVAGSYSQVITVTVVANP